MCERGFSLVELIIVIAIMGILLSIATHNWNAMQTKSAIESQIKKIHADLMEVRVQALYGKRARTVVISDQVYKSYSSAVITSTALETKQLRYPIVWSGGGTLTFDAQGLTNDQQSLCVLPTNNTADVNSAAVDSIVVSQARINLGKRTGGDCAIANIEQK
jgi:prepilin-type N-terminal cleavage/methylation domain-containing protein